MKITIQAHVFSILLITTILIVILLFMNRALKNFDPYSKPKGLVLISLMAVEMVDKTVKNDVNDEIFENLGPYIGSLWGYILLSSISGLFGLQAVPTGNLSVTLTLAIITVFLVEFNSIKYNGIKNYVQGLFEPFAFFLPINIFSKFSPIISLSLRLFANVLTGTIMMTMLYTFTGFVSSLIPIIGSFNFFGVALAPIFHAYFDLISGLLQTFIFTSLTIMFISKELPEK
ncbi:MAG: F0F1 ATP synthase subunit A [Erysipelotrichaceae bacterium]|nr:F0F1 ATP synthase subunit A [Erysipelotrichaceae bacterium]